MIPARSRGLWLLVFGLLTGLLALAGLTAVARAASAEKSASVSIAIPVPYATVVDAVRAVCADGVIRGTSQYESESTLSGAKEVDSSTSFAPWAGSGEAFYKTRPGAVSPTHFAGSKDMGAVTVRYVVEPAPGGSVNVRVDAVFVENSHHGRHPSQGFVERAEFGEIAKQLKNTGALAAWPQAEAPAHPPEHAAATKQESRPNPVPPAFVPALAAAAPAPPAGRTYPRTADVLKTALQEMGAFDSAALPALEGFADLDADTYSSYERPQYQFRAEFVAAGAGKTTLHLIAVITARYMPAAQSRPEYRTVPSNGRLEADLFDRLDGYLGVATGASAPGAAGSRQQAARSTAK
jgi:hypothetical protein